MRTVLDYLYKDESINGYIIRALLNDMPHFHCEIEVDGNNVIGLLAVWESEKIATLRGELLFCRKWFEKLYGEYNFYDLENRFSKYILQNHKINNEYFISDYLFLEYINNKKVKDEVKNIYSKINKNDWLKIRDIYKKKYNIDFTEFEERNMEWLVVYEKGYPISNICLEKVSKKFFVLSNFYTAPDRQNKGVGTNLLRDVLNSFENTKFGLFVNSQNTHALNIYRKLGFNIKAKLVNFELK
jgi:ribosomal protein S18 acetylase RimI-like enzyme